MVTVGSPLPSPPKSLWETKENGSVEFPTTGKFVLVGVPGAFTPPCSSHVPGYVILYDEFVEKGISDIYVVSVNDFFVVNAWKEKLAKDSKVHFIADSTGAFIRSLGLDFDASGLLGGTRSKRFAAVIADGIVTHLEVEAEAPDITGTAADALLKNL